MSDPRYYLPSEYGTPWHLQCGPAFSRIFRKPALTVILSTFILAATAPGLLYAELNLTGRLNVNTATKDELLLLPHIGGVKAQAIYRYRGENGKFKSIESLLGVKGIGEKTLGRIRPYIKLSGKSDLAIVEKVSNSVPRSGSSAKEENVMLLGNESLFSNLLGSIRGAKEEVVVSMFLFKTSKYSSNRANMLLDALGDAAQRGVRVFILLERSGTETGNVTAANMRSAERLVNRGVEVAFDDPRKTTHTKAVVIDRETVFLGSHNFTHSAMKYNNELSVRIDSSAVSDGVLSYVEGIR